MMPELNKIYTGDCLEIMREWPDNFTVITDPPYGINLDTRYMSRHRGHLAKCSDFLPVHGDNKPFEKEPFMRFLKKCFFGANHIGEFPSSTCWIIWDKRDNMASNDQADCEIAWTNFKGPIRLFRHMWNGMIRASETNEPRAHPTQKPIALFEWIIRNYTEKDEIIVDPFAGSGPCLIAAERQGRKWIGVEINPDYVKIAEARIAKERSQLKLPL